MSIAKKKILTVVMICIGTGALVGVAGYFHGLGGAVTGGVAGAVCALAAFFLLRQPSR